MDDDWRIDNKITYADEPAKKRISEVAQLDYLKANARLVNQQGIHIFVLLRNAWPEFVDDFVSISTSWAGMENRVKEILCLTEMFMTMIEERNIKKGFCQSGGFVICPITEHSMY